MPINASPHYLKAEAEYLQAETTEQKIRCLKKMIALAPKHKGAENLLKQLKTRLAKLKYTSEKESKQKKSHSDGIKKHEMQSIIVGETNVGKSTLLNILTNAESEIASYEFTTKNPKVGMFPYESVQIQLVENPAIESEYYDKGLPHTTDVLIILITELEQLGNILKDETIEISKAKKLITFNNKEKLNTNEQRKLKATLDSKYKKHPSVIVDLKNKENIEELKEKLFNCFDKIRVFTKEPGKEKTTKPIVLEKGSIVKDVAEKILKGFSNKVKEARVTGPSSKFPNQKVGLKHELKDLDVVEFKTF